MLNQIPAIILFVILGINLWYIFAIIYHLIRFGISARPKVTALLFFSGSVVLLLALFSAFNKVDWFNILIKIKDFLKTYFIV